MALANVNNQKRQVLSGLLAARPTAAIFYGDVYYATDNGLWYIYTPSGWIAESLPAIVATFAGALPAGTNNIGDVDVLSLPALPAGTNNIGDVDVLTLPALPAGTNNIGDVDVVTLPGTVEADIGTTQDDIALIKAQNQTFKSATHTLAFAATGTSLTSAITYNGLIKHLLLVVPNFTNVVTATLTLEDAAGRVLWTSAAKARNAYYNLELDTTVVWIDQGVYSGLIWKVTISGVAGGTGGDVVLVPRYYGV